MNESFAEIARKAAAGTLSPAERDWLEAHLREFPAKRAEIEWDQAFSAQLAAKIASMPAMPGWERTAQALRSQQLQPTQAAVRAAPGILDRLAEWIRSTLGVGMNMQAIAVALVLAQAGALGMLVWHYRDTADSEFRAGTGSNVPRGPLLRVSFKPDIRETDLRKALADVGAEIVGGPGQMGIYLLRIKDGDLNAAAERLRGTGTTELVEAFIAKP